MILDDLADWGTFLSGLGTLLIAIVGGAILAYDVQLRRRQLRETLSRSYSTLNIDFQVSIHPLSGPLFVTSQWILESRIIIHNAGSEIRAIPAAYVHARAVAGPGHGGRTFSERDFSHLSPAGQLSEPLNAAWFRLAIWHVGPGEVDSVVRWDILSAEFMRQHPVIIARAGVYSVPSEFVGSSYSAGSIAGTDRNQWMEFMEGEGGVRHKQVIFSQADRDVEGIRKGSWVFLKPGGDGIDVRASKRFRTVLSNFCHTGRQVVVVLNTSKASELRNGEVLPLL